MLFFKSLSLGLLLAPVALAAVMDVTVGSANGTLEFSPEAVFANPGDQVVFHFMQKNHSAVQSSLAAPCSQKAGGFNSGFNPVPANQTDNFPTYTVTVNDTQPIWVFCSQAANTAASHCGAGMVFAINCGADGSATSFTNFKDSALAIGQSLQAGSTTSSAAASATTSASTSGTGTSSGAATTHTVVVGNNNSLTYSPSEVSASVGDVVLFQFTSKNHTVTQSTFAEPCLKRSIQNTSATAFDSGFMPVAANSTSFPTWSLTVNDTTPIWVYCRQTNPTSHCGAGMVMAINAVDSGASNFTAYRANAMAQNGTNSSSTSSSSGSAASASSTSASGASRSAGIAGSLLAGIAVIFALIL